MTSRLDRLILLLDTGSSPLIRETAAQQIGTVIKHHPQDIFNILQRVFVHVKSKSWDTRNAACNALQQIAQNIPQWNPTITNTNDNDQFEIDEGLLTFEKFDIHQVLQNGALLVGSEGKEFDEDLNQLNPKDKIIQLKKQLKHKLGLGTDFMELDFFNDRDLEGQNNDGEKKEFNQKKAETILTELSLKEDVKNDGSLILEGLSSRERNRMKRKMKLDKTRKQSSSNIPSFISASSSKKRKPDLEDSMIQSDEYIKKEPDINHSILINDDQCQVSATSEEWPFEALCEILSLELFSPQWETRHGAALALSKIILLHGNGAGMVHNVSKETQNRLHVQWQNDLAIRLLCLMALDRFADYVSDQIVVPVREISAQCLGILLKGCNETTCKMVLEKGLYILMDKSSKTWELRHTGLIGLKYFLAIRQDLIPFLLKDKERSLIFMALVNGLTDFNDDIRTVASTALLTVSDLFLNNLDQTIIYDQFVTNLWNALEELDDLASSTASIMDLLSVFLQNKSIQSIMHTKSVKLSSLVSFLFPFFRHAISSVRTSVLKTLITLVKLFKEDLSWITVDLLRLVFQNFFLEDSMLLDMSCELWMSLMSLIDSNPILKSQIKGQIDRNHFLNLINTSVGMPLNDRMFLQVKECVRIALHDKVMAAQELSIIDESIVYYGRLHAASAIGKYISITDLQSFKPYLNNAIINGGGYQRIIGCIIIQQAIRFTKIRDPVEIVEYELFDQQIQSILNDNSVGNLKFQENEIRTLSTYASVIPELDTLPAKLNPLISSLMNSLKNETIKCFQERSAESLSKIIQINITNGKNNVNIKLIQNLVNLLMLTIDIDVKDDSILSLLSIDAYKKHDVSKQRKEKTNDNTESITNTSIPSSIINDATANENSCQRKQNELSKAGAELVIKYMCHIFDGKVFEMCPKLKEIASLALTTPSSDHSTSKKAVVECLIVLRSLIPHLHHDTYPEIENLLPSVCVLLKSTESIIRYHTALCLSSIALKMTGQTMQFIITNVIPFANDSKNLSIRKGVAECIFNLINTSDLDILPYIVFLIVPVLGRMSDSDEDIRFISTNVFAQLVNIIPLEAEIPDPIGISEILIHQRIEERKFLAQLVGTERIDSFELPKDINATLRPYQKEGVSWMAFLKRYGLHGILCDDMGLGKTLQSICILASDHNERANKYLATKEPEFSRIPSLVVCPTSLCHHWNDEITKYAPFLKHNMIRMRKQGRKADVMIMSYESVRNDLTDLIQLQFNYMILDEGHIIKNPKTKVSESVKSICAMKRLILSGTPIQNNVLELWSLFDFLMPGFLGTERQFNLKYAKSITASKEAKTSSKEQANGALALEALHRQVLPFILRRMKEDVLDDLPPKIIQDFECDLSPLQKMMYESFSTSEISEFADEGVKKRGSVLQSLQYLRRLVNHPALVYTPDHKMYGQIKTYLLANGNDIMDIKHAPKITALKQILMDCGIGNSDSTCTVSPHRALIFCQLKSMVDILENQLFKKDMPSVTYKRLDGTVSLDKRHEIVKNFNSDPSIDVLLLTTHVGGLGLNLTGADTVIFFEHDWNPMKDAQAMDRAHRIGQKRVVNVYRLITRGTLEEKIMGLQKFKLSIASSIINQDNSGLSSMNSDQILDLFSFGVNDNGGSYGKIGEVKKKLSTKQVMEGMDDLWKADEYEDLEMDGFLSRLN